jgi:membrane protein YdbS with pleckstrin-like domain
MPARQLLDDEQLLHEGRADWRAFPGMTILGFVLAPVVVGLVILAVLGARKRGLAWMVSTRRIEVERGWLSKQVDTLELWRVRDVELRQGLLARMLGVATIRVISHDEEQPALDLPGIPEARDLYNRLTNAVMAARQQRGMINVNS